MNQYIKDNRVVLSIVGILLIVAIIFGAKSCSSSKDDDQPLDYFGSGTEHLTQADKAFKAGEKSRDRALRAQQGFANQYGDQDNLENHANANSNGGGQNLGQNQSSVNPACPTCPQKEDKNGRRIMEDAETEAREYAENEDRVNRMNNKNVQTQKTSSSNSSISSARPPRYYRPVAPKPQIIIIKERESSRHVRESISTDTQNRSTTSTQKVKCIGCDGAISYSEEIRQRQLESKRRGYNNGSDVDPLCLLLPADPKHPNKPREILRAKTLKEKQEFMGDARLKEGNPNDGD